MLHSLVNAEVLYEGRFVRVKKVPHEGHDYEIVDKRSPNAVAIVPFVNPATVLLCRQHRPAAGAALLEVPAGLIDPHESPFTAAKRELREETGYIVPNDSHLDQLWSCFMSPGYSSERIWFFAAHNLEGPYPQKLDPTEKIELVKYSIWQVKKGLEEGEFQDAKTIMALQWALQYARAQFKGL
jgi:ADP-ribose pyrophosphatase